jgi:DNA-binding transcriptional MerR regulator
MLGVSPNTLRSWERRYGFPRPHRSPGGHRQYALNEIEALRTSLAETHNVSSAVALAQQRGTGPSSPPRLASAFASFDEEAANLLLEESLALRSVERTVEDLLLEAVAWHGDSHRHTAEYDFAWRHATGWLSALKRISPPVYGSRGVLLLDASGPLDLDALYAQALDLVLRRAGVRTLSLSPAIPPGRVTRGLRALNPEAVVLTGQRITLDGIGRLVYTIRAASSGIVFFDYRGALPDTGASAIARLGEKPIAARDQLLIRLGRDAAAPAASAPRAYAVSR